MNAMTGLVAIASLLLALTTAGAVANKPTDVNSPGASRNITPSKLGVNHNQTMVSDAALVQQADTLNEWLMGEQAFGFFRVSVYPLNMAGCPTWLCGMNHNETLVSDATMVPQRDTSSEVFKGEQAFGFVRVFLYAPNMAGCPIWMCGTNHNETLVSDATMVPQRDTWSEGLRGEPTFGFVRVLLYAPNMAGCPIWMCGTNHNETLVIDATPVQQKDTWSEGLRGESTFGFVRVLLYPNMAGCPVWMCGTNHNETLVRDVAR